MNFLGPSGKVSLSNIIAWKSCAWANGYRSQLPNHQGLSPHTPLPSAKLNAYSNALHTTHTATPLLPSPSGCIASAIPAKLAPRAGDIFEVSSLVAFGCRLRKVRALGRSRFDRNVVKKRDSRRWRNTRRDNDSAERVAGE